MARQAGRNAADSVGGSTRARNVAVLTSATGGQLISILWHMQDRTLGKEHLQAINAPHSVKWGADTYEGILAFTVMLEN
eukprot:1096017-Alexandrium_andersonii.AAC.1